MHQPFHIAGKAGEQTAHVVVDADDVRERVQVIAHGRKEFLPGHVQCQGAGAEETVLVLFQGLHGQMQQHFLAVPVGQFGHDCCMGGMREDGVGQGTGQFYGLQILISAITDIINNDADQGNLCLVLLIGRCRGSTNSEGQKEKGGHTIRRSPPRIHGFNPGCLFATVISGP